jgi:hypothetical protein
MFFNFEMIFIIHALAAIHAVVTYQSYSIHPTLRPDTVADNLSSTFEGLYIIPSIPGFLCCCNMSSDIGIP